MNKINKELKILNNNHSFDFQCTHCNNCCTDMDVKLSPYDIILLCRKLGITTTEFHKKYTEFIVEDDFNSMPVCYLKTRDNKECVFLQNKRCIIYEARPLPCRMFPIGTALDKNAVIRFYERSDDCPGKGNGTRHSVKEWLRQNNAEEYFRMLKCWGQFIINVDKCGFPDDEKFLNLFTKICYDFDSTTFQKIIEELGFDAPKNDEEKISLIAEIAEKVLITPFKH